MPVRAFKDIAYKTLFKLGSHKRAGTGRLILMYHGVTQEDHTAQYGRHLPVKQFEQHLIYFKKYFNILPLEELLNENNTGKRPALALTFDDGFENNLLTALPVLEKQRIPAMFYITTSALHNSGQLFSDLIDVTRAHSTVKEFEFSGGSFQRSGRHRLLRKKDGKNIYSLLTELSPQQLIEAMRTFTARYGTAELLEQAPAECYRLLNASQVQQLSASPLATIGSHTHHHFALTTCTADELSCELSHSKSELEKVTGKKVAALAFPYGDHDQRVILQARNAGYTGLLSAGISGHENILPRLGMISAGSFEQNMMAVHKGFRRFGF